MKPKRWGHRVTLGVALIFVGVLMVMGARHNHAGVLGAGVVFCIIGFALVRSGTKKTRTARSRSSARSGRATPAGWTFSEAANVSGMWAARPQDLGQRFHNVYVGRSHHRRVAVFHTPHVDGTRTWMAVELKGAHQDVTASSDGVSQVSVTGPVSENLTRFLQEWSASRMVGLSILENTLFVELTPLSGSSLNQFVRGPVHQLVELVATILDEGPQRRQTDPRPRPVKTLPPPSGAPLSTAPASLRTGPIVVAERPALQPAAPDPVASELETQALSTAWQPREWTAPPISLDAVPATSALGEAPTIGEWKPREWTAPSYERSSSLDWEPAETWQPSYGGVSAPASTAEAR